MSKTLFDLVHNALRPCLGKALPRDCLSDILLGERNPLARYLIAQGSHVVVALDEYSRNADSSTRGVTPRATPLCLHPRWCTMQVQDLECDIVEESVTEHVVHTLKYAACDPAFLHGMGNCRRMVVNKVTVELDLHCGSFLCVVHLHCPGPRHCAALGTQLSFPEMVRDLPQHHCDSYTKGQNCNTTLLSNTQHLKIPLQQIFCSSAMVRLRDTCVGDANITAPVSLHACFENIFSLMSEMDVGFSVISCTCAYKVAPKQRNHSHGPYKTHRQVSRGVKNCADNREETHGRSTTLSSRLCQDLGYRAQKFVKKHCVKAHIVLFIDKSPISVF